MVNDIVVLGLPLEDSPGLLLVENCIAGLWEVIPSNLKFDTTIILWEQRTGYFDTHLLLSIPLFIRKTVLYL